VQYQGDAFDFSKTFERISVFDSILHYNADLSAIDLSQDNAAATAEKLEIKFRGNTQKHLHI
jgi:lysyl-tRNA synthetase class 2